MNQKNRWKKAQGYEKSYWDSLGVNLGIGSDWYEEKAGQILDTLTRLRPNLNTNSAKILELGTGPFGIVSYLHTHCCYGVDPLEIFFSTNPETARLRKANVTYLPAKGENLPFKGGTFDVVILDNVLDHTENPESVLQEAFRVMAPAGVAYFEINIRTSFGEKIRTVMELLQMDRGHPFSYSKKSIKRLLGKEFHPLTERCGRAVDNVKYYLSHRSWRGMLKVLTGTVEFRYYAFLEKKN
jgi:SAM-dependent methyltransferase